MRENDGRKLDHKTLEALRFRAVQQVAAGAHPEEVAAALGMHGHTVYGWLAKQPAGGDAALEAQPVPGRPPKLTVEQARRIRTLVVGTDPRPLRFDFALWTRDMVGQLIVREFGISLGRTAVGRLLRSMGLSPQRPLWRAWQADPDAVQRWKDTEFPAIRTGAKAEGATVYFGDEAGIRSDYHAGTTWAPVGKTPIVKATGARHSLNMMSAVTAQGLLRYTTFTGTMNGPKFVEFCKKLLADTQAATGRGVYLIVDGHPAHKAKSSRSGSPPPRAASSYSSCRPTPRSSTPTSGSGRTSSTTTSAAPAPRPANSSSPWPAPRYAASNADPTSSVHSSPTPTWRTSPHDNSTYLQTR